MPYLIERRSQVLFVTASLIKVNGKRRKIIIESRPEFAIIKLQGSKKQYPISWEQLFKAAQQHHAENLRIEAEESQTPKSRSKKPSK
jgi:hypothetical protein